MQRVRLGKTDLEVSPIAFGTWAYGGEWGSFDRDEAVGSIHHALDLGINLFDTAQAYGFGRSEELLADALWPRVKREDVVVATKGGLRPNGDGVVRDSSAKWLREGVEESLRHLRTDYIDLYQVHWPDPSTPAEETGAALNELVREGKIRHAGVSNYDVAQMAELARYGPVETLQPPYHAFRREIEREILPYTAANDIGVLIYGPLAHGLMSGRMTADTTFAPDDWRSDSSDFRGETLVRNLAVVDRLRAFARGRDITMPQLAVAWTLANPAVDVAIVGARRPDQLDGTASGADVTLTEDDLGEIGAILQDAVPVRGASPEGT
jgi:aryl-alcohol dehydrogenase-like predicted oxidoreductase